LTVHDIGELGLLQRIAAYCPPGALLDDAAEMAIPADQTLIVTTDVLVDGVHFSIGQANPACVTTPPWCVGWRATAANLSDLAAMGASPAGVTIALGLPGETPVDWIEGLYAGVKACLDQFGGQISGGDLTRSPVLTVSITALGQASPQRILRRKAAQPGHALVITGPHGLSRAGLELLLSPEQGQDLPAQQRQRLIQAHQQPRPRFDAIATLHALCSDPPLPMAGMDSSDGLANAVLQICRASGVGARVLRSHLPIPDGLAGWLEAEQAMDWMLYGGEDFELVLSLPDFLARALVEALGPGAAIIGYITASPEVLLVDETGQRPTITLDLQQGFQHF
jgi:thiamine-monophosphate kinase